MRLKSIAIITLSSHAWSVQQPEPEPEGHPPDREIKQALSDILYGLEDFDEEKRQRIEAANNNNFRRINVTVKQVLSGDS